MATATNTPDLDDVDVDGADALTPGGAFRYLPEASSDELASMALQGISDLLRAAQWPTWGAAFSLKGARQERAKELIGLLGAARAHCDRLLAVVESDCRVNNPDPRVVS